MTDTLLQSPLSAAVPRFLPLVTPAGINRLPLWLVLGYLGTTFALFLLWPINWPIYHADQWALLIGYVTLCYCAIAGAAILGSSGATRVTAPFRNAPLLILVGTAVALILLAPSSYAYTGRWPWEVIDALGNQAEAYRRLQDQLLATSGQRGVISGLRALLAPITFAVLPLGILHWRNLTWLHRGLVGVAVVCSLTFSLMRGTDKEIADLFIIGGATLTVALGRSSAFGQQGFDIVKRYWKPALLVLIAIYLAAGLFTSRKDERLGGYANRMSVCANDSRICVDLDNDLISWMPLRQRFGATFFILSTCSGYFGLNLALEKPLESTLGAGHSPAAMSVYKLVTGDYTLEKHSFTYRNRLDGWSDEYYWSTLITWIANDVGFPGAVLVLALLGFLWGKWWREATAGVSDPAAILFVLATMMMVYLPANNQVLASYDGYPVFAVWIAIWLWHRRNRALSVGMPG